MASRMTGVSTTPSGDKWVKEGARKRAGVLVPLFSAHSSESIGVGDLADLRLIVDLCKKTGDSIIQLLPMNEVGSVFCPYDAVSSFALEPLYIALDDLPLASEPAIQKKIVALRKKFPAGKPHVDYAIKAAKMVLLRTIFAEAGEERASQEFRRFCEAQAYWLHDFALFKALKKAHEEQPWYEWAEAYELHEADALEAFARENEDEVAFQKWVQWHLFRQLAAAKEYAAEKGVLLKGDLPILISRDSADVWAHPEFFKLGFAAGSPPDMYCAKGQRWGMPTYNWDAIAGDGYRYLAHKLAYAGNFYDILRIDHVVGLFRIWSIPFSEPAENEGLNGSYDPRDEGVWGAHGKRLLSEMLKETGMLLCAEDLGTIPQVCFDTLKEYGIPGNNVQRWTKDWDTRHDFLEPHEYRLLTVAMLSTHDTTTFPGWWEKEAGTVDEALFKRMCAERGIDYAAVEGRLFDPVRSRHGRLRWHDAVASEDAYVGILGRRREEIRDFIDMYLNTFGEKEKLWKRLGMAGAMRERSDATLVKAALGYTMASNAAFCIELIFDRLFLADAMKGDPYRCRVNRPGTVGPTNWSLTLPLSLEELMEEKSCGVIQKMVKDAGRL